MNFRERHNRTDTVVEWRLTSSQGWLRKLRSSGLWHRAFW